MPTFSPNESEEACPHCFDPTFFQVPSLTKGDKVYKDECMYSFNNNTDTVYVCMKTFRGYSADYIHLHKNHGGNPLFLAVRKLPKPPRKTEDITDLSQLGVEEPDKFELKVACTECNLVMPENVGLTEEVIVGIKGALSPQLQATIADAKDSFAIECPCCVSMVQPESRKYKPGNPPQDNQPCWYEGCGHTQNNWICLHCGEVGCPRKEAGGKEHAIFHYMMTGHSVVVKSGTITPLGADLYCYKCNDDVKDPKLKEHLNALGINMDKAVKTSKSMAELQLDATHKWDFGKLTESGKDLKDRFGPGHTGLINLGNSCYMNSVLQSFFALPEFKARFFDDPTFACHQESCKVNPANCFQCQMRKLARGFWSGDHSQEGLPYHRQGIAPRDFKTYIAGGHKDFSTGEQQDAEEYTRFLLDTLSRKLKEISGGGAALGPREDPSQLFDFLVEERKQCSCCGGVSYRKSHQNTLCLNLPLEPPADPSKKVEADDRPKTDVKACLDLWTSPNAFDCKCEACGTGGATYVATSKLATFPDVIAIHPRREYFDKNFLTTRKLDCYVDFPEELDLSDYKGNGLQPDEKGMKVSSSASSKPAFQPDEVAYATLLSMGIEDDAATAALKACDNNAERAIEWVFTEWPAQQAAASEATKAVEEEAEPTEPTVATNGEAGKYELFAMVSHIGSSALSGHYIAHVKKEGKWSNCNDEKVKFSEDPPFNMASIFFYRRV